MEKDPKDLNDPKPTEPLHPEDKDTLEDMKAKMQGLNEAIEQMKKENEKLSGRVSELIADNQRLSVLSGVKDPEPEELFNMYDRRAKFKKEA